MTSRDHDDYDPNDPAFLISRRIDGDLTEHERNLLGDMLANSEALRDDAERLTAVHELIRRWAVATTQPDSDRLHDAVIARVADTDNLGPVDRVIRRWALAEPNVDLRAFRAGVMARIKSTVPGRARSRILLRLGLPLAAAAAIVMAVTAHVWTLPGRGPTSRVVIGPRWVVAEAAAVSRVSFNRAAPPSRAGGRPAPMMSYVSIGSASASTPTDTARVSAGAPPPP